MLQVGDKSECVKLWKLHVLCLEILGIHACNCSHNNVLYIPLRIT